MDFKDLTMQFQQYISQGTTIGSLAIIRSHNMEKLLKKGHFVIIFQLDSIQAIETSLIQPNLQAILSHHPTIFQNPQGLSPLPRRP
jgi:hypothetical protein